MNFETPPIYPLAKGKDIHRYYAINETQLKLMVLYPYDVRTGKVLSGKQLEQIAPNAWHYLQISKNKLSGRDYFEKSNKKWYELWCPRDPRIFLSPKIVGPEIAVRGEFSISRQPLFINNKIKAIILKSDIQENIEYILGLINSRLLVYLHRSIAPPKGNNYFEVKTRILGRLPIRRINYSDETAKVKHDKMVYLVNQMLNHNKQLAEAKTNHEQNIIQRQITATDHQIDQLVYQLYNLTPAEIKLVEESTR